MHVPPPPPRRAGEQHGERKGPAAWMNGGDGVAAWLASFSSFLFFPFWIDTVDTVAPLLRSSRQQKQLSSAHNMA